MFNALEFNLIQQISFKHFLNNFMSDKSENWADEYRRVLDPQSQISTHLFQNKKLPMVN